MSDPDPIEPIGEPLELTEQDIADIAELHENEIIVAVDDDEEEGEEVVEALNSNDYLAAAQGFLNKAQQFLQLFMYLDESLREAGQICKDLAEIVEEGEKEKADLRAQLAAVEEVVAELRAESVHPKDWTPITNEEGDPNA